MDNLWYSHPGLGFFHNLYAISIDGQQIWKLTDIPIKQNLHDGIPVYASINPVFNKNGSKLMWTERYSGEGGDYDWGNWRIKMADFIVGTDSPSLQNIEIVLDPYSFCGNSNCQYANGMAFIDDTTILVTGDLSEQHVYGMDQYTYNFQTKVLKNLLNTPLYWEEGSCYSDGKIVYMTNQGSDYSLDFDNPDWASQPRTREYWIMNVDGSNKKQLTYFNTPGSPEHIEFSKGRRTIVAECEFSPDGRNMLGVIGFDNGGADTVEMTLQVFLFQLGSRDIKSFDTDSDINSDRTCVPRFGPPWISARHTLTANTKVVKIDSMTRRASATVTLSIEGESMDKRQYNSILDAAIASEIQAQQFYAQVAERMKNDFLKELFNQLFQEEQRHQKILEGFKARGNGHIHFKRAPDFKVAETVQAPQVCDAMRPADAFALAMKKEEEAMNLYTMLADSLKDPAQKNAFLELAAMERGHKQKMENAFVDIGYPEKW